MRLLLVTMLCSTTLACSDRGGAAPVGPDARRSVDGGVSTVPFPSDAPARGQYVLSAVTLPTTSSMARSLGCDFTRSGLSSNQAGNVFSALRGTWDTQGDVDANLAAGRGIQLLELVSRTDLATAGEGEAGLRWMDGAFDPPFDASRAYSGSGHFSRKGTVFELPGRITGGVGSFGNGPLDLPLALLEGASGETLPLFAASVNDVRISPQGLMQGRLCAAIPAAAIATHFAPMVARSLETLIGRGGEFAADACEYLGSHRCGTPDTCRAYGAGQPPPRGCVDPAALVGDPIFRAVMQPDVLIDGRAGMSLGLGFTAVPATF